MREFTEEQLIELEALTGRFARLSDLLIQKVFKTIDRPDNAGREKRINNQCC